MEGDDPLIPGWYGKIPCLGDFASRRLPSRFIVAWDDWLQRTLAGSRALLGEAWLDTYLTSPVWRFLLMPEVCGNTGWAGVLMPSVDRVGRYFPLTIAAELPSLPARETDLGALSNWLDLTESVALAALNMDCTCDDLERRLSDHRLPPMDDPDESVSVLQVHLADCISAQGAAAAAMTLPSLASFAATVADAGSRALLRAAAGKSLWWSRNREGAQPLLLCCEGLPGPDNFAMLLRGAADEALPTTVH
jgi:type VI secretion system protein ImpM